MKNDFKKYPESSDTSFRCPKCGHLERDHFQNPMDLEIICEQWGCRCSREALKNH